jgi:hypothetical protein
MGTSIWRNVVWCAMRWFINVEFGSLASCRNPVLVVGMPWVYTLAGMEVSKSLGLRGCKKPFTKAK